MSDIAGHIGVSVADQSKIFFAVRVGGWVSFRKKPVSWTP